ncbi:hypothetical protein EJ04DRAFT_516081 [Polyplosphaeria fusca]|uniref:Uncharacterized protein n=1 Tax=Polyplosphaeria fusca TaxID=682080 RepID=A0A9P4QKY6_9PLEO|nr:hypothetical protein EJ04DRAFT_516081 [Polyplosphaeria fusca]
MMPKAACRPPLLETILMFLRYDLYSRQSWQAPGRSGSAIASTAVAAFATDCFHYHNARLVSKSKYFHNQTLYL